MAGERILIVDDDRTTAKVIELQLLKMGYAVVSIAQSGQEAIAKTKAYAPDLLLMDINLGKGMDGIDVAKIIKDEHKVPVIYLTAYSDDDILVRALETQPLGYVNKPLRETDLRTTISLALAQIKTGGTANDRNHSSQTGSWNIRVKCDANGNYISGPKITDKLKNIGIDSVDDLLPETHLDHVQACLTTNKPQLMTGKYGNSKYSIEYSSTPSGKLVDISITEVTESDNPVNSDIQKMVLLETLDHLTAGVVLLNEHLRIFYSNRSAEILFESGVGLVRSDDYLACEKPEVTAELHKNVLKGSNKLLIIERGKELKPLNVLTTPLQSYVKNYGHNLPTAILFAFETLDDSERVEVVLRSLYNLSPSEAKLTAKLLITPDLQEAAKLLNISIHTARTHLKRVYVKTNTNRLSSLVHLIITGPIGVILHTHG